MPKPIRPIRIEGNLAYVPLTQGYEAVIDAADVPLVEGRNWHASVNRSTVYAQRSEAGAGGNGPKHRAVQLHRVIMGEPKGLLVDHRDGDGLNNRRSNLRMATRSQNQHNQKLASHNTSGFKGVRWDKQRGKWQAAIRLNGKRKHLGFFPTPEAAYEAYCKGSAEIHGEFGRVA